MDTTTAQPQPSDRWPGAFGVFKPSLRTVAFNLIPFVLLLLLSLVFQGPIVLMQSLFNNAFIAILLELFGLLISLLLTIAIIIVLLDASESKKITFKQSLEQSLPQLLRYLGLSILSGVIAIVSLLLFIVPFFFIFPRIMLASYFLLDQKMSVIASLNASWEQTRGHVGKIYGIVGVNLLMIVPMFTIIGIPVALFLLVAYSAATITLYKYILTGVVKDPVKAPIEAPLPTA